MRTTLVVLSLLLASLPALGRELNENWVAVHSPNFLVLTDSSEKQARHVAGQFERMRALFHKLFPNMTSDSGAPIVVIALRDRKEFRTLEPPEYLAKNQLDLAGYFMPTQDKNYVLLRLDTEGEEHPFAVVYHEYTHFMVRKEAWLPLWLNEGMAEYYQNTDIDNKEVVLGQPSLYDLLYLQQHTMMPLTTLLTVDHSSPYYHNEEKGSVFYAQSWAVTHYLMVSDKQNNTHRLLDYANYLNQHEDPVTAATHAFGDLKKMEQAMNKYVNQGSFGYFKMKSGITVDESSFQAQPLPPHDVDAYRAAVLFHNHRNEEAEALLESSLHDDSRNPLLHETMGFKKYQERDSEGALKWFKEAIDLGSQSFLAHYYFSMLSMKNGNGSQDAAIESSLKAAIKLNPDFAPSYDMLAMFYVRHNEKFDEAHMLSLQAVQLEPENVYFRRNSAEALLQQGQYENALAVLKGAQKVASRPSDVDSIQQRIDEIQTRQAAKANAQNNQSGGGIEAPTQLSERTVVTNKDGRVMIKVGASAPEDHKFPEGEPTGPKHTVEGVIHSVQCTYPALLTLGVKRSDKTVTLYSNNFYKVSYMAVNFTPTTELDPCTSLEGMKAKVDYAEVKDDVAAGQIISVEISK